MSISCAVWELEASRVVDAPNLHILLLFFFHLPTQERQTFLVHVLAEGSPSLPSPNGNQGQETPFAAPDQFPPARFLCFENPICASMCLLGGSIPSLTSVLSPLSLSRFHRIALSLLVRLLHFYPHVSPSLSISISILRLGKGPNDSLRVLSAVRKTQFRNAAFQLLKCNNNQSCVLAQQCPEPVLLWVA